MKQTGKNLLALLLILVVILLSSCQNQNKKQDVYEDINEQSTINAQEHSLEIETEAIQQEQPQFDESPSASESPSDSTEKTVSNNGVYYGKLEAGITETLTIQNYSDEGFDFQFEQSRISGRAQFDTEIPDAMGVAFYYDEDGQGINFEFDEKGVIVGGGYHYGSLAAHYTP